MIVSGALRNIMIMTQVKYPPYYGFFMTDDDAARCSVSGVIV